MEKTKKICCVLAIIMSILIISCSNSSDSPSNSPNGSDTGGTTTAPSNPTTPTNPTNPTNPTIPTNPTVSTNSFVGTWLANTGNKLVFYSNLTVHANWMGYGNYSYEGNSATIVFGSSSEKITISGTSFYLHGVRFVKQL